MPDEITINRTRKLASDRVAATEQLRQSRNSLASAEARYMRSRSIVDGNAIGQLTHQIRLLELSLKGFDQSLGLIARPAPVQLITTDTAELHRQKALILQQQRYRHAQHQQQVDRVRAEHKGAPPVHLATYMNNAFASSESARKRADAADDVRLANLDAQLAELERRSFVATGGPEAA